MIDYSKVPSAARYDYVEWNFWKMYIGLVFLVPIRLVCYLVPIIIGGTIFVIHWKLCGKGDFLDEQSRYYHWLNNVWLQYVCTFICRFGGGITRTYKKHKISDYLADYKGYEMTEQAPIIVSNHVTGYDMIVYLTINPLPSFIAKISVASLPCIGQICTRLQSLYIARDNSNSKNEIMDAIKKRIEQIQSGKRFNSLVIFPEGTTNNGQF